jgi:hypothetical protein
VLVALACVANTASAAGGTPASLAANVAAATVGHHPYAPVRWVVPPYRRPVVVAPALVPPPVVVAAPVVAPRAVYYGPRYRPYWGGSVYVETPYLSLGVGY